MKKIGFMFGAGAEISYGLPTGGDFALNIFRQDSLESKERFKSQRAAINLTNSYAQWLPDDFENKNISVFRKKAFEDIIRSTVEQNRDRIIKRLNALDSIATSLVSEMKSDGIDINSDFEEINNRPVADCFMNRKITFVQEFKEGDDLFRSNYFSALLMAYKNFKKSSVKEANELGRIVISILQLQIGALGEKLTHRLNEGIFNRKDDELDILDDLGDIIQLDYQSVGTSGLEYLLDIQEPDQSNVERRVLKFAQKLIEKIYACVLDYKSLIDSNWMYLYHPNTEWSKFCKISIFLLNVQKYINEIFSNLPSGKDGYYDDVYKSVEANKMEICATATSNYSPLISNILKGEAIIYLNGSTTLWYDPYLNRIGTENQLTKLNHFIVPLMFTQSGTKPMISIDMSSRYVEYYNALAKADEICVIGFGFNSDDEHINGIFRDLVDCKNKSITVVTVGDDKSNESEMKKTIARKLKLHDDSNISVILVDDERKQNGVLWIDYLLGSAESE
ncbi:MAG: hypothetical protein ACLS8Q_03820 [Anaerovoracaceae bacterium]